MKKKVKNVLFWVLFACLGVNAQMNQYTYKRVLPDIKDTWHAVHIPDEVFNKVASDLSDIRIFGITSTNDTIEAPYVLKLKKGNVSQKEIPFTILNTVYNEKGSYITLEIPTKQSTNQIQLDFEQSNFDWLITLEGSQDQKEWYTVAENYRILSIKNDLTKYKFTSLRFPEAQYHYFKIWIKNTKKPILKSANVINYEVKKADYRKYEGSDFSIQNLKDTKNTIVDVTLQMPVSISYIDIETEDDFDYYRPISIKYIADSIQVQQSKWKSNYRELSSGILNSIEDNIFTCKSTIAQKIRIVIDNHDNQPLKIKKVVVKGYQHELITRFTSPATYYLVYGNDTARMPSYDLNYVSTKIPNNMTAIMPGIQEVIDHAPPMIIQPLFTNKIWLWVVMFLIIVLLGGFTFSMMRKK